MEKIDRGLRDHAIAFNGKQVNNIIKIPQYNHVYIATMDQNRHWRNS